MKLFFVFSDSKWGCQNMIMPLPGHYCRMASTTVICRVLPTISFSSYSVKSWLVKERNLPLDTEIWYNECTVFIIWLGYYLQEALGQVTAFLTASGVPHRQYSTVQYIETVKCFRSSCWRAEGEVRYRHSSAKPTRVWNSTMVHKDRRSTSG